MNENTISFDKKTIEMIEKIFSGIFIIQNRMQNAGEKLHTDISMKQWLLIAMADTCEGDRTLTNIGNLMGCSRQNVKKLALALEKSGFAVLKKGSNNSILVELTDKTRKYAEDIAPIISNALRLLFLDFSEEEIEMLYSFYSKLHNGIERVEKYAGEVLDNYMIGTSVS